MKAITVFAADLHIHPRIWNSRPSISGDSELALRQIAAFCVARGAPLILGGDTTDVDVGHKSSVEQIGRFLEGVLGAGVRLGFINGNHDPSGWLDIFSSVWQRQGVAAPVPLDGRLDDTFIPGHRIWGMNYRSGSEFQAALPNIPEQADVLVCHQRFAEAFRPELAHAKLDDLPEHVRLALVGDIHTPCKVTNARGQTLAYPGCPYLRAVNDSMVAKRGMLAVGDDLSVETIEMLRRPAICSVITDAADIDATISALGEMYGQALEAMSKIVPAELAECVASPLAIVRYSPAQFPDLGLRLSQKLFKRAHIFDELVSDAKFVPATAATEVSDRKARLADFLADEIDRTSHPAAYAAAEAFLDGQPFETIVRTMANSLGLSQDEQDLFIPRVGHANSKN